MIRICLLFIMSACLQVAASAQQIDRTQISYSTSIPDAGERLIGYDPNTKLSIEDFKGSPKPNGAAAAITNTGFMFALGYSKKEGKSSLNLTVYCTFNREKSWMKENAKTPYILSHEQHHFDICYLGAVAFLNRLRATKFTEDEYRQQLQELYDSAIENMNALQEHYDESTAHGTNPDVQQAWNNRIDAQLATLTTASN